MKIEIKKSLDVKYLYAELGVRYWDDGIVNGIEDDEGQLIPLRKGDYWCLNIDVDGGFIVNWPKGTVADVHYKVCDDGLYILRNEYNKKLFEVEECYVPSILSPGGDGFGDYVIMSIDETGYIDDWDPRRLHDFFE